MSSQLSSDSHEGRESERRRFYRYAAEAVEIRVHSDSKTVQGKLVNESIGGVAVFVQDASSFVVGQEVAMNLHDATSTAYVRSVRRMHGGRYRIGVSWEKQSFKDANAAVDYLVYENLLLVCQIVCEHDGPVRVVKLWDGAEFNVPSETVRSRSFDQRRDELNEYPTQLPSLAELYGLNPHVNPNQLVADILAFEFSPQFQASHGKH